MGDSDAETSPGLTGLAERWESCSLIRQKARKSKSLIEWPTPEPAGVASMTLVCECLRCVFLDSEF